MPTSKIIWKQKRMNERKKLQKAISMHTMFIMAKLFQHENPCAVDALVDCFRRFFCQVLDPFSEWIRISFELDFLCFNFLSPFFFVAVVCGSECDLAVVLWLIHVLTPKLLHQYIPISLPKIGSMYLFVSLKNIWASWKRFSSGRFICRVNEKYIKCMQSTLSMSFKHYTENTFEKKNGSARMRTLNVLHSFGYFDFVDISSGLTLSKVNDDKLLSRK